VYPDDRGAPYGSFQGYGGAIAASSNEESAFSHRNTMVEFVASRPGPTLQKMTQRIAAARRYGAALEPFAIGVYVNVLSDEGEAGVRRAYPPGKLAQLAGSNVDTTQTMSSISTRTFGPISDMTVEVSR
jgi:hypothetical protein